MKSKSQPKVPKMKVAKATPVIRDEFQALDNFTSQLQGRVDGLIRRVNEMESRITKLEEGGSWRQLVNKLRGF